MKENSKQIYLRTLGPLLIEMADLAKREVASSTNDARDLAEGRYMAMYEILSLMVHQAETFDLAKSDIGLDTIVPDRDFLTLEPR